MDAQNLGGRPIDPSVVPKVMRTARELVTEKGYEAVTITMIADIAGVGRQTVYRRWRSKADLVLDAYFERTLAVEGVVADGSVASRLKTLLLQIFEEIDRDRPGLKNLIAAAQADEIFRERFDERLAVPSDEMVVTLLQAGIERGELSSSADLHMMAEIVHGAIWYRLLLGRPLDADLAARLTATVLGGGRPTWIAPTRLRGEENLPQSSTTIPVSTPKSSER